ncbi:Gag-Pol polyprotein [Chionoecetes opilio]|uniref:Gag-Pol polyprotein n=1 Tax=Chionoecetes opilio TaxID=41210 RepID=A0A8J4Y058_CHIOP|nr:Gag-Pol polyprotein [Chionoecetes opilio]
MGQLAIELKTHISEKLGRGVGGYQGRCEGAAGLVKEEPCSASEWFGSDSEGEQVLGAQRCGVLRQVPSARATPKSAVPTPPSTPSLPSSPSHKVQGSRRRRRCEGARKRPQEFDGTVSWEDYRAQFELLAEAWGWSRYERAVQLVGALKGSALEVLNQLPAGKQTSYSSVLAVLEKRYGHQHQSEVFRARFRARLRNPGESLPHLAQDLEQLVRRAYPGASEDMITLLLRDQFVDAVNHPQTKIYIQQAHVENLQQALARGLEMESFLRTSREVEGPTHRPRTMFKARKWHVQSPPASPISSAGALHGNCFRCGQQGHWKRECPRQRRQSVSPRGSNSGRYQYKPCCWDCGQAHRTSECPQNGYSASGTAAGNCLAGSGGPTPANQPETPLQVRCRSTGARTVQVQYRDKLTGGPVA